MTTRAQWDVWSTTAEVSAEDPADLPRLRRIAEQTIDEVDRACSRFRTDSEITRLSPNFTEGVIVSTVLARIIRDALAASRLTEGLVDPTLGSRLHELGWVAAGSTSTPLSFTTRASWRDVHLSGHTLTAPANVTFDFGAIGKATTSDLIIERAVESGINSGALVSLGGDIATSPASPDGGWVVNVQDLPDDPVVQVSLSDGAAIATSSTRRRRLKSGTGSISHIIDPRSSLPVADTWGAVTAVAGTCAHANSASTAAVMLGDDAPSWLDARHIAARLVRFDGTVTHTANWPGRKADQHV